MILEELIALLGFEIEGEENLKRFRDGIQKADGRLKSFARSAIDVGRRVALGMAAMGAAAVAAGTAMFKLANSAAAELDTLAKTAGRVGLGVEALQELRYAASQAAGVTEGTFDMAMQRFSRRVAEAANGSGELKDTIEQLGISLHDSSGNLRAQEDILADYGDAIAGATSDQEALRLAFKAFDSEGATLVNMFRQGSDEIARLRAEFNELGLSFSREEVERATKYGDQVDRLSKVVKALGFAIGVEAMPFLMKWMDGLEDWYKANQAIIRQNLAHVMSGIGRGVDTVGQFALSAGKSIRWLSEQITALTGIGVKGQAGLLGAGAVAWLASRHPVLAALAAAFLILDDYRAYLEDEDSLIGDFFAALDKVDARLDEARARQNALLAEQGKPPLLDLTWIERAIQQLRSWDEALQSIIGAPPEILMPRIEWNIPDALAPIWRQFEQWWDNLSEGFYNAGANSINRFLDGLKSIGSQIADFLNSLIPQWFKDLAGMQDQRQAASAEAGRTVGAMVQPAEPQRRDRVAPPPLAPSPAPERFALEIRPEPVFDLTGVKQSLRSVADTIRDWMQETLDGLDMGGMVPATAGGPQARLTSPIDRRIDRAHDMPGHNTENPALAASIAAMAEKLQAITGMQAAEQYVNQMANDHRAYNYEFNQTNQTTIHATTTQSAAQIGAAAGGAVRNAGRDIGRSLAVTGNSGGAGR